MIGSNPPKTPKIQTRSIPEPSVRLSPVAPSSYVTSSMVSNSVVDYNEARHDDLRLETDFYACLPLCSFAHACEGRSPQAGTSEIAIATHARPCGIGRRNGMPWVRLIPRVGMLTTTGPLGTAQAGLPTRRALYTGGGTGSQQGIAS
uniref:Uncharacterized protein n=1 Tax=Ananas comosus var. bracteatus TaxID=296719 RepID=A0A6V7QHM0_ANACO|nr:unnamed protein product [Ananas comosus var. bracteatus]